MGIAGGTVADWRNYDSVYTERYMGTPQQNPDGYRSSSPRWAAANLHGALLLIHGAIDDNVHISNTMQLVYELQKAREAVPADALSEVAARRHRSRARPSPARPDVRLHYRTSETVRGCDQTRPG